MWRNFHIMSEKPFIEVAAAVIWKRERLLITRRPEGKHLEGIWEFPGGKREPFETLEECVRREIREELGLEVEPTELLLNTTHEYETRIVDLYIYRCRLLQGVPRPLDNQEITWVKPEELENYRFPPPDRKVIDLIVNGQAA